MPENAPPAMNVGWHYNRAGPPWAEAFRRPSAQRKLCISVVNACPFVLSSAAVDRVCCYSWLWRVSEMR